MPFGGASVSNLRHAVAASLEALMNGVPEQRLLLDNEYCAHLSSAGAGRHPNLDG